MTTFQAKISWERPRKSENKKKNLKNQTTLLWILFKPRLVGNGQKREREKNRYDEFLPVPK